MKKIIVIAWLFFLSLPVTAEELKLATQPHGHKLSEESKPYVCCALDKLNFTYSISHVPWERAQRETAEGRYHGFFIATRNDRRDRFAEFSKPFYSIKWIYVGQKDFMVRPDSPGLVSLGFSADIGSARLVWLEEQFTQGTFNKKITAVDQPEQILKMIQAGRVDVGVLNHHRFRTALNNLSLPRDDFRTFVMRTTPAGIYFNKEFLVHHPGFLGRFNHAMDACKNKDTCKRELGQ